MTLSHLAYSVALESFKATLQEPETIVRRPHGGRHLISLNKPFLANGFVIVFASHFSLKGFFCFLLRFLNRQSFLTNQLTEHSSRQSGDYLPGLILVVNILLWSNTVFIITRHCLYGKPASYIYTGAVISSNSVGLQNSASRLAKPTSHSTMAGIMYLKNLIIYLKFCFGCFDFIYTDIIFCLTVQPRWHLTNLSF